MKIPLYQIDAFAEKAFEGNPAAVCPLESWLPEKTLQAIAEENNLADTAFYVERNGDYELRWFTPTKEVDLCGHATLAAAHVVFQSIEEKKEKITFHSKSGPLHVSKVGKLLELDFPAQAGTRCEPPPALIAGLGQEPMYCYKSMDYMAVYKDEGTINSLSPNLSKLMELDLRGVIVTAPGSSHDFVSRFFAPNFGVSEDPVTGSAHCTMLPYWADKLKKNELVAKQLSKRTGIVRCRLEGDRVMLSGKTVAYLEGFITIKSEQGSSGNG